MNPSPWIILFAPFVSAVVIALITEKFKKLSSYLSVAAVAISFVFSLAVFFGPNGSESFDRPIRVLCPHAGTTAKIMRCSAKEELATELWIVDGR